ncbi:MAG: dsDNA nuclease domain-containing protein [Desulfitobacteriaceae bacterium]|nr:dsDNA nuclease domain-containing protein [Desulfitobacteriaceae bacterium]
MPGAENTQIDSALSTDVGDETSNRFRYQWVLSAIICCMLLDQAEDAQEVFCEHHEDVLIKHVNGLFTGIQVKTRASDQSLWKASDEDVVKAFARFVILDSQYPRQFQAFKFITNHPIQSSSNGQDIAYLLRQISQSENYDSLSNVVKTFIRKISRTAEIAEEDSFHTLKKASIKHDLPKFRDATMRLIDTIVSVWDKAKGASYEGIKRAASHLIDACFRASSLASQDLLPAYLPVSSSGVEREIQERIAGKTFNKQRVYDVLLQGLDDTIPLSCDPMDLEDIRTGSKELLRKKLTTGGFSAISTIYAEDLRDTADYAGARLIQKYGREQGLQKYYELRLKVQGDAARAYEKEKKDEDPFGLDMLSSLRGNLKNRALSGEQFYGCSVEHLEGLAYSLTSQCKVIWSINRPWEVE